jgi:prepilin-type N-terminal cleavage/methylation domain-containing protein
MTPIGPQADVLLRSKMRRGERPGGFTLFEFAVVVVIVGVLAIVLLERLLVYQEYAEKTAMEMTVRNVRTGLRYQIADLMNQDRMREVDRLLNENPVTWLETPPPNYLGQFRNPAPDQIAPGNWYFDTAKRELVYLPNRKRFFKPGGTGRDEIRFRVTAVRGSQKLIKGSEPSVQGLTLNLLNSYQWDWPQ